MDDWFSNLFQNFGLLLPLYLGLFVSYRIIIWVAEKFSREKDVKDILEIDPVRKSYKLLIKLKEYFSWNVMVNTEKGTAGGNIKINFPVKSVIPGIFLLFAIYYFKQWFNSLQLLQSFHQITDAAKDYIDNTKKLQLSGEHRFIAGVCGGLSTHFGINVILVRLIFSFLTILYGLGLLLYLFLFITMNKSGSS